MGYYSTGHAFAASSCGLNAPELPILDFGFSARTVLLGNYCGPVYFNLLGQAASTAMGFVTCNQTVMFSNLNACGIGLATTSTTTAAGGQPIVGVTSWGP